MSFVPLATALVLFRAPSTLDFLSYANLETLAPTLELDTDVDVVVPFADSFACISYSHRPEVSLSIWRFTQNHALFCTQPAVTHRVTNRGPSMYSLGPDSALNTPAALPGIVASPQSVVWDLMGRNILMGLSTGAVLVFNVAAAAFSTAATTNLIFGPFFSPITCIAPCPVSADIFALFFSCGPVFVCRIPQDGSSSAVEVLLEISTMNNAGNRIVGISFHPTSRAPEFAILLGLYRHGEVQAWCVNIPERSSKLIRNLASVSTAMADMDGPASLSESLRWCKNGRVVLQTPRSLVVFDVRRNNGSMDNINMDFDIETLSVDRNTAMAWILERGTSAVHCYDLLENIKVATHTIAFNDFSDLHPSAAGQHDERHAREAEAGPPPGASLDRNPTIIQANRQSVDLISLYMGLDGADDDREPADRAGPGLETLAEADEPPSAATTGSIQPEPAGPLAAELPPPQLDPDAPARALTPGTAITPSSMTLGAARSCSDMRAAPPGPATPAEPAQPAASPADEYSDHAHDVTDMLADVSVSELDGALKGDLPEPILPDCLFSHVGELMQFSALGLGPTSGFSPSPQSSDADCPPGAQMPALLAALFGVPRTCLTVDDLIELEISQLAPADTFTKMVLNVWLRKASLLDSFAATLAELQDSVVPPRTMMTISIEWLLFAVHLVGTVSRAGPDPAETSRLVHEFIDKTLFKNKDDYADDVEAVHLAAAMLIGSNQITAASMLYAQNEYFIEALVLSLLHGLDVTDIVNTWAQHAAANGIDVISTRCLNALVIMGSVNESEEVGRQLLLSMRHASPTTVPRLEIAEASRAEAAALDETPYSTADPAVAATWAPAAGPEAAGTNGHTRDDSYTDTDTYDEDEYDEPGEDDVTFTSTSDTIRSETTPAGASPKLPSPRKGLFDHQTRGLSASPSSKRKKPDHLRLDLDAKPSRYLQNITVQSQGSEEPEPDTSSTLPTPQPAFPTRKDSLSASNAARKGLREKYQQRALARQQLHEQTAAAEPAAEPAEPADAGLLQVDQPAERQSYSSPILEQFLKEHEIARIDRALQGPDLNMPLSSESSDDQPLTASSTASWEYLHTAQTTLKEDDARSLVDDQISLRLNQHRKVASRDMVLPPTYELPAEASASVVPGPDELERPLERRPRARAPSPPSPPAKPAPARRQVPKQWTVDPPFTPPQTVAPNLPAAPAPAVPRRRVPVPEAVLEPPEKSPERMRALLPAPTIAAAEPAHADIPQDTKEVFEPLERSMDVNMGSSTPLTGRSTPLTGGSAVSETTALNGRSVRIAESAATARPAPAEKKKGGLFRSLTSGSTFTQLTGTSGRRSHAKNKSESHSNGGLWRRRGHQTNENEPPEQARERRHYGQLAEAAQDAKGVRSVSDKIGIERQEMISKQAEALSAMNEGLPARIERRPSASRKPSLMSTGEKLKKRLRGGAASEPAEAAERADTTPPRRWPYAANRAANMQERRRSRIAFAPNEGLAGPSAAAGAIPELDQGPGAAEGAAPGPGVVYASADGRYESRW
ncbi:uncharacterized protein V1510DRAFT_404864 [Dipodascopsis tothii]|uniref:uncharacterized protein n=1 Tax=Dipodascopsis tothii TaxID=44089 RepID=UPI0034CDCAAD